MTQTPRMALSGLLLFGSVAGTMAHAATQGKVHVAVYSGGFLVETDRDVLYGPGVRREEIKSRALGTAAGEAPEPRTTIAHLEKGIEIDLDPQTKTWSERPFMSSGMDDGGAPSERPLSAPTLKITRIEPKISGPLGSDTINGFPAKSFSIRLEIDFSDVRSMQVAATEVLVEKLWVTDKAPAVVEFRRDEENFEDALFARYGTARTNLAWLLRQFNRQLLDLQGQPEDLKMIQAAYRNARRSISGVTVRQLAAWSWQPRAKSGMDSEQDMTTFIASLAAGLGAPPDAEGKTPLAPEQKPSWVTEMEKMLKTEGPAVLMLGEVRSAARVVPNPKKFGSSGFSVGHFGPFVVDKGSLKTGHV